MKVALQAANGAYVSAVNGGDDAGLVFCTSRTIGPNETWELSHVPGGVTFQSVNGRYLSAEGGGGGAVHANRLIADIWETFTPISGGFQCFDQAHWLTADLSVPEVPLVADRTVQQAWELFTVVPLEKALPRVHADGLGFVTETGDSWIWAMTTGFRDYERFLRGEDISPLLAESQALGANGRRVFGMFDFGTPDAQRLYPREHADYYDRLPEYFALNAAYGQYPQFVVFADTQRACPVMSAQFEHWGRVMDILRPIPNAIVQSVNEPTAHENRVDANLPRPVGILAANGSGGSGDDPPQPFWDYACLHSERRGDFALSTTTVWYTIHGYGTAYQGSHCPTVVDEPPGFDEVLRPGRRTNDPRIAYLLGLGCRWGAGGTAHSTDGAASVLLRPIQRQCVSEFLRGVTGR